MTSNNLTRVSNWIENDAPVEKLLVRAIARSCNLYGTVAALRNFKPAIYIFVDVWDAFITFCQIWGAEKAVAVIKVCNDVFICQFLQGPVLGDVKLLQL